MLYDAMYEAIHPPHLFDLLALDYKSQHGLRGCRARTTFPSVLHVPRRQSVAGRASEGSGGAVIVDPVSSVPFPM